MNEKIHWSITHLFLSALLGAKIFSIALIIRKHDGCMSRRGGWSLAWIEGTCTSGHHTINQVEHVIMDQINFVLPDFKLLVDLEQY